MWGLQKDALADVILEAIDVDLPDEYNQLFAET
jgi:hypothetical protein